MLSGQNLQPFSWQELPFPDGRCKPVRLRHFIRGAAFSLTFSALQPGHPATEGIRRTAAGPQAWRQIRRNNVALTGPVPMNDDQFSVIRQSAIPRHRRFAVVGVLVILWLALRSWKLILAVLLQPDGRTLRLLPLSVSQWLARSI